MDPLNAPIDPEQGIYPPLVHTTAAWQGKAATTIISEFKKTESLLIKKGSPNSTSNTSGSDDETNKGSKNLEVEGGKSTSS